MLRPVRPGSLRLLACLAVAALLALAQFHVRQAFTMSIQYDDAHNANVAKNLAMGFGYSTSYHEIVPFNPEASTGPVVLIARTKRVLQLGAVTGPARVQTACDRQVLFTRDPYVISLCPGLPSDLR